MVHRGRHAVKLTEKPVGSGQLIAIIRDHPFRNGTKRAAVPVPHPVCGVCDQSVREPATTLPTIMRCIA
jgi:hypothetical protein